MCYRETQGGLGPWLTRDKAGVEVVQKPFVWLACTVISLLKVAYLQL